MTLLLDYSKYKRGGFSPGYGTAWHTHPGPCYRCSFCGKNTTTAFAGGFCNPSHGDVKTTISQCISCGWWLADEVTNLYFESYFAAGSDFVKQRQAIVRRYRPEQVDVPIQALRGYISKKPEIIHRINPTSMELLVQSVFRDYYSCEVKHVGCTGDGGIDLLLVDSDRPALIQVKRRGRANQSEGISAVREFLGAVLLAGSRRGIYITTAGFSGPARSAADEAKKLQLVDQLDLVDLHRFLDLLRVVSRRNEVSWTGYLNRFIRENQLMFSRSSSEGENEFKIDKDPHSIAHDVMGQRREERSIVNRFLEAWGELSRAGSPTADGRKREQVLSEWYGEHYRTAQSLWDNMLSNSVEMDTNEIRSITEKAENILSDFKKRTCATSGDFPGQGI